MITPLISIAVLHWAVLVIPGFNFVLIGQLAAGGSRKAAMSAVVGMTLATLIWATLAVAGVGVVFAAHPFLRLAAQIAGGVYLLHLAFKLWFAGGPVAASAPHVFGSVAAFRAGLTTGVLNPKIALFYGSVFTTSLPSDPPATLVLLSVLLVFMNSVVWHSALALLLSRPSIQNAYLRHHRVLNRLSAALVGGYGARLLLSTVGEIQSRNA